MVARPWGSSRLSCGERLQLSFDGNAGIHFRPRRERIPPLELGGGNGAPLDAGGTLVLPLEWRRVCRGTSGVSPGESVLVSSGGMHVSFPPELKQQCHTSLRVDQEICGFPLRLSHEAFPRGFLTGLSHDALPWCESILGVKVEAVQGKQVSLEWTETSGGLWEWWHDPGGPLAFPGESASS